jgi:serine/threonine-protein kinase
LPDEPLPAEQPFRPSVLPSFRPLAARPLALKLPLALSPFPCYPTRQFHLHPPPDGLILNDPRTALETGLSGSYALERELGRGGMATVYLAQDLKHGRPVALKVLRPALSMSMGPDRFRREITTAARLQHPHILSVHDSGETEGLLWYTMPYVRGESLKDRLKREGRLPLEDAIRITAEAGRALDYAHREGVIHRDIKPENILLTLDGDTLVADFGIARALGGPNENRLTQAGLALGTPAYMAPEQATGERGVDARTDQYSLAIVC